MSVPPLRLYNNFETFYSGEVIVHASAVIAPGVIMQAAPNSKIIIGSGVCIGMGVNSPSRYRNFRDRTGC